MKCMLGLLSPDAGSIEISGRETIGISRAERSSLMRKIGVVFQPAFAR
jgi:phospholipid/cholesterol/gamma-HCH transport system ATP-binding protein